MERFQGPDDRWDWPELPSRQTMRVVLSLMR